MAKTKPETKSNLLITNEWYENCKDNKQIAAFNIFCSAYSHNCGTKECVSLEELTPKLNSLGVTNDKISKLFDYIYVYDLKINEEIQMAFITGFCDVTNFMKCVKTKDDRDFFSTIIKIFLKNGGVVRYNDKDYVLEDGSALWDVLKPNLP
ncbi:MAG: hypothetical protein J6P64_05685 [Bacteroidales bacterium]|nr:hypothetical protein [Bacteroidales bacterium]